ncbi:MAG: hypothetical protein JW746_02420 [Candidatus Krumholzibacteriota bacterium]|nr:hypothetical protein [Candidatus Krumholzibacteriota bacterium]
MSNTKDEVRGCIDLGSSYFRLLVVRGRFCVGGGTSPVFRPECVEIRGKSSLHPGGVELLSHHESRRYIGWGDYLQKDGKIPGWKIDAAGDALVELEKEAVVLGCDSLYIVATNTVRMAANSTEIIERFGERTERPVSILTFTGEAALGLTGAATLVDRSGEILFADPGGTSTEIASSRGGRIDRCSRYPYGTHSVRSMIVRQVSGAISAEEFLSLSRRTVRELKYRFDACLQDSDPAGFEHSLLPEGLESPTILFTGGTAVSLAVILGSMKRKSPAFTELAGVTRGDLSLISRRLAGLFSRGRQKDLPLAAERVELIIPGLILVRALMDHLGIDSYNAVTRDLRWGVILSGGRMPGGYCVNE